MMTKINSPFYDSSMNNNNNNNNNDDQLFSDEQIQRYDADTIRNRYGENWRNYASNIRDIKQADGSIVREYIIEDPSLLKEIQPSADSASSTAESEDDRQSSKHKFAQIKAKFEQKTFSNVMASPSPSSSSVASSHTTTTTNRSSNKQIDDYNIRNRRDSNDSLSSNRTNNNNIHPPPPPPPPISSNSSFRHLNSADEADDEVRRIHRHQQQERSTPISSIDETKQQSNIQYEIVDEDGNPMAIDGVQDLIKMSGVTAREVPQPDGTLVREYVIDDPNILSKFQSQQQTQVEQEHIPPPPPRIPLKQSVLFRQEPLSNDHELPAINIQQIRTLEPQRRYEFITTSGKRIEFMITNLGTDESDVQELANAINTRLLPSSSSQQQQPFTLPKPWHPAIDLTSNRQRTGSENQPIPNNYNPNIQQIPDFTRGFNQQQQFAPVFTEPIIDWSAVRQQDPYGQVDPQLIRQFITQKHQTNAFQTSAQFLPEQQQQQSSSQIPSYPYQGQQQHGVRILPTNPNDYDYNQQQIPNGHTRI